MGARGAARRRLEALAERRLHLDALLHDRIYRAIMGATGGLAVDVVFAAWNLALGAAGLSLWFATMGLLYLMLAVMRFLTTRREVAHRRDGVASATFTRVTGGLMIALSAVLGLVVLLTIVGGKGAAGNDIVVISQATYTFYVLTLAAINYARARRASAGVERMLRSVSASAALVSLLSLQTTMIDSFGGNAGLRLVATACTGAFVCAACALMGVDLLLGSDDTAGGVLGQEAPMTGKQSRYFETAALIDEAFLSLLSEKDFEFITVKEICQRAEVSRSTFYLHYETLHDLLAESVEYVTARFLEQFEERAGADLIERIPDAPLDELRLVTPGYLLPYLAFICDNQRLFGTLAKNYETLRFDRSLERMMRHVFVPILKRFGVAEQDHPYLMAFYLNGLMAIINEWLRRGCVDDVEYVARLMQECCAGPVPSA